jgi:transcription elongation factor Elf1
MEINNKEKQYKHFECPFCSSINFILKVDERISLAFSESNHFFEVDFPVDSKGNNVEKTVIRFKLICEKCRKELKHTNELVEAIDYYIS